MNLRVTIEYGDYNYQDGEKFWTPDISKILELTPYEFEKHRKFEDENRMFLIVLREVSEEIKKAGKNTGPNSSLYNVKIES